MFERLTPKSRRGGSPLKLFTPAAKRAMLLAKGAALASGSPAIEGPQLLVGVLSAGDTLALRAIMGAGTSLDGLYKEARAALGPGSSPEGAKTSISPSVMARVLDEAADVDQAFIGAEHLLLAALGDAGTAELLARYNVTRDRVKAALAQLRQRRVTEPEPTGDIPTPGFLAELLKPEV